MLRLADGTLDDVEKRLDEAKDPYSKRQHLRTSLGRSSRDMDRQLGEAC